MKPIEEEILSKPSSSFERRGVVVRPQKAAAVNCPRCDSTNTKFCYYNNYSLSQPRYFCKTCRRYWTEGGTLRNIPVGGGSRKNNKRSYSTSSYSSKNLVVPSASTPVLSQNPRINIIHHDQQFGQDLNLGFPSNFKNHVSEFLQVPNFDATKNLNFSGLIPDPNSVYTPPGTLMIPLPEFKIPSLGFSLDGGAYGNSFQESNSGRRLLFPFEELKTDTSAGGDDDPEGGQSKDQNCDSGGFWNGMMGGGASW